ncbi:HxlR family transcriptional regulator [Niabella ginsenosidivorans]|uniref:HxlR family transcriptional regulator n=1 Tax=Niabella ginsenosidivorans TaxID=1176587 RepID=A0A1A9I4V8_9BACT|nr:helix-turn-helix domain-containing protein [Niabella ginsenosidivorans]ANH82717.1 HxlR family transcriptional regulator [Niabella ginsenosidivorans]
MIVKGKNVVYRLDGKLYHCPMDITMKYIGGKWKAVVLWYLKGGTLRFAELKKRIPAITEKMLSIQLHTLEADGLIERKVYGSKPPVRVEYSLTEFGKTLIETLNAISKWGRNLGANRGELVELQEK